MTKSHGLGTGRGALIEHEDGTVEYRETFKFIPVFHVRISDVTSFSTRLPNREDRKRLKANKNIHQILTIMGAGTVLAEVPVSYGTPEKIEEWFRSHPKFGANQIRSEPSTTPVATAPQSQSVADEILKLAKLLESGVLTKEEFDAQKKKLLKI